MRFSFYLYKKQFKFSILKKPRQVIRNDQKTNAVEYSA